MEGKMSEFKKVSHCWWFDSHNSAKRSPWLQLTLSELEKKTKGLLNLIEGDADSFAQRAEIYYSKRPELVNLIEDFYRSYRFLAEQHELLRSEVGSRRTTLFKCDSLIQSTSPHKTWDSTDNSDYPESEISEVDNLEQENDAQIESLFSAANEEMKGNGMYLEVKSSVEDNFQEHQVETKLQKQEIMQLTNDSIEPCTRNTESLPRSSLETILRFELEDTKVEAHGTKNTIHESKLTSEVDGLKMDNLALTAELERKDEDKRHVIRELSMAVDILKEENSTLKNFIKKSKRSDSSEFTKLKVVFSRTARLFGLTSPRQPSLVAL